VCDPTRDVTDSQLRNWVRGERSTPPDREKVAEWLAALDEVRARERAVRPVLDAAEALLAALESRDRAIYVDEVTALDKALAAYRAAAGGSAEADEPGRDADGVHRDDVHPEVTRALLRMEAAAVPAVASGDDEADVHAARARVAADAVRKAIAYRLGVTGLARLDTAADLDWLTETGRRVVTALDAAEAGVSSPAPDRGLLREVLDALGMDRTRDWDDVLNVVRCWRKQRAEAGAPAQPIPPRVQVSWVDHDEEDGDLHETGWIMAVEGDQAVINCDCGPHTVRRPLAALRLEPRAVGGAADTEESTS
jgi:hypothetical protein